jgi:hypothetical protein
MSTNSCPCCGRAFPKAKLTPVVNVAELSEKDMFAHYKRTAPVENVKFQLRLGLSPDLRAGYTALLEQLEHQGGKASPATNREYLRLQELWRMTPSTVTIAAGRSGWKRTIAA